MAEKLIYITYDNKHFDDLKEGFAYDMAALRKVANELWFIKLSEEVDGFNRIPFDKLPNSIVSFNHSADIMKIMEYFVLCPIVYCATDRAAEVLTGLLKNPKKTVTIEGLAKGINYWFDGDDRYYHEEHFIDNFQDFALTQFCRFKESIEKFIENNGIAA